MRKLVSLIMMMSMSIMLAGAISYNEIINNPERYNVFSKTMSTTTYIDVGSVKQIRYEPPYYILQGDVLIISWDLERIFERSGRYYYDLNVRDEIKFEPMGVGCYYFDGREFLAKERSSNALSRHHRGSAGYDEAEIFFSAYYGQQF